MRNACLIVTACGLWAAGCGPDPHVARIAQLEGQLAAARASNPEVDAVRASLGKSEQRRRDLQTQLDAANARWADVQAGVLQDRHALDAAEHALATSKQLRAELDVALAEKVALAERLAGLARVVGFGGRTGGEPDPGIIHAELKRLNDRLDQPETGQALTLERVLAAADRERLNYRDLTQVLKRRLDADGK